MGKGRCPNSGTGVPAEGSIGAPDASTFFCEQQNQPPVRALARSCSLSLSFSLLGTRPMVTGPRQYRKGPPAQDGGDSARQERALSKEEPSVVSPPTRTHL